MNDTLTLTGYLGRDPEIRETRERKRTYTRRLRREFIFEYNGVRTPDRDWEVAEEVAEYDVNYPPGEYAVFQLAVHTWKGRHQRTDWHRIIVWNVDTEEKIPVRILRKGSKVEVTGIRSSYTFWDEEKKENVTLEQVEASEVRILKLK